MEKMRQTKEYASGYQGAKANFFGRRSKLVYGTPRTEPAKSEEPTTSAEHTDSSAGRPYFPSNGSHRHLNFLGRTSWDNKDRLLVNRVQIGEIEQRPR